MTRLHAALSIVVSLWLTLLPVMGSMAWAKSIAMPSVTVFVSESHDPCDSEGLSSRMVECHAASGCTDECSNFYGPLQSGLHLRAPLSVIEFARMSEMSHAHIVTPPFRPPMRLTSLLQC